MSTRYTLLFLLAGITAQAATYYCDPLKGNAKGDGSAEHPWGTIEEVIQARLIQLCDQKGVPANPDAPIKPGNTILLRAGWHGILSVSGGYNQQSITIAATPGQTAQVGWVEVGEGKN